MKYLTRVPLHREHLQVARHARLIHVRLYLRVCVHACSWIADHKYHDDFERGGVKKLIMGSSWNNGEKNRLAIDLCQVEERSNVILLVVLHCVLGL